VTQTVAGCVGVWNAPSLSGMLVLLTTSSGVRGTSSNPPNDWHPGLPVVSENQE